MKIVALVENTSTSPQYGTRHGLCLYIETASHKILFDLGPDELFLENAKQLNIDIDAIDTVVISHGHDDHGGALGAFLTHNHSAKVYIHKNAFHAYYAKALGLPVYIGLDASLKDHERVILTEDRYTIDEGLILFSGITERECYSSANKSLLAKNKHGYTPDLFDHEQNLIITENDNFILFSGCSHNGVINIQKKAEEIGARKLSHVIGGFHLYNPALKRCESRELISDIGSRLKQKQASYYTCHCTGQKAYEQLKDIMGNQIDYLAAGRTIVI